MRDRLSLDRSRVVARLCRAICLLLVVLGLVGAAGLAGHGAGAAPVRIDVAGQTLEVLAPAPLLRLAGEPGADPQPSGGLPAAPARVTAPAPAHRLAAVAEPPVADPRRPPRRPPSQGPPPLS